MWKYFGLKRANVAQTTVICKTCYKPMTTSGGNMSNLFSHQKNKNIVQHFECRKIREESSAAATSNTDKQSQMVQHGIALALASYTPHDQTTTNYIYALEFHQNCIYKLWSPL